MAYVLPNHAVASLAAFVIYGLEKRAARLGRPRVPAPWLHALELLNGWPGALVAQSGFEHQRCMASFLLVSWAGSKAVADQPAGQALRTADDETHSNPRRAAPPATR